MTLTASTALLRGTLLLCMALACTTAGAQQRPLTGQMLAEPAMSATPVESPAVLPTHDLVAPPAPAPPPAAVPPPLPIHAAAATPRPARAQIGDTTRAALRLQASGEQAGPRLPILGDQATLSYARYLKSFEHPIPEYLQKTVRTGGTGSSNGE